MTKRPVRLAQALLLTLLLLVIPTAGAAISPPQIIAISFPAHIPTGGGAVAGTVLYRAAAGRLGRAQFDVLDGGFDPFTLSLDNRPSLQTPLPDGPQSFSFRLACDPHPRHVILKLQLFDRAGRASSPAHFAFYCDSPPAGDFLQEEAQVRPTRAKIVLNFYFLDDGVSTITRGTHYADPDAVLAPLAPGMIAVLKSQIIPALGGIWDQCSLAFRLGVSQVVRPQKLIIPGQGGRNLAELFFGQYQGVQVIFVNPTSGTESLDLLDVLRQAGARFDRELAAQGSSASRALDVFIIGRKGLLSRSNPLAFGGVAQIRGRVNVVHWQAVFFKSQQPAQILLPQIVIQAMAHEIGHNLGLFHVTPQQDSLNLMISQPELPRLFPPTVHLLPGQCAQVAPVVAALASP